VKPIAFSYPFLPYLPPAKFLDAVLRLCPDSSEHESACAFPAACSRLTWLFPDRAVDPEQTHSCYVSTEVSELPTPLPVLPSRTRILIALWRMNARQHLNQQPQRKRKLVCFASCGDNHPMGLKPAESHSAVKCSLVSHNGTVDHIPDAPCLPD
jgi:hypothetical protein